MVLFDYLVPYKRKTFIRIILGKLSTYLGVPHYFLKSNDQKILGFKLTKEKEWLPIHFSEMPGKKKNECNFHIIQCISTNIFVKFSTILMN